MAEQQPSADSSFESILESLNDLAHNKTYESISSIEIASAESIVHDFLAQARTSTPDTSVIAHHGDTTQGPVSPQPSPEKAMNETPTTSKAPTVAPQNPRKKNNRKDRKFIRRLLYTTPMEISHDDTLHLPLSPSIATDYEKPNGLSITIRKRTVENIPPENPPLKAENFRYSQKPGLSDHCHIPKEHFSDTNDCPHSCSNMFAFKPQQIVDNHYHGSMLQLLREIQTRPCDSVSPAVPINPRHRLKLYGCMQQHWNPKVNMPVLFLVAPCGSSISTPSFRRSSLNQAKLKFIISTHSQQESATFLLPLLMPASMTSSPVVITSGPSNNLPDTYTSYVIKATSPGLNLLWIKVMHMSVLGCFTLHTRSVYMPPRPAFNSEIHILGLPAKRTTPYSIFHWPQKSTTMSFLDDKDLEMINYKLYPNQQTLKLWVPNHKILQAQDPLLMQTQFTTPAHFNGFFKITLHQNPIIAATYPHLVPNYYPAPRTPKPPTDEIRSLVFQDTEPMLIRRKPKDISTRQVLHNIRPIEGQTQKQTFLKLYDVLIDSLDHSENLDLPLSTFLCRFRSIENNGICEFKQLHSTHEPYTNYIPRTWRYVSSHPAILSELERTDFPAQEDHDWA